MKKIIVLLCYCMLLINSIFANDNKTIDINEEASKINIEAVINTKNKIKELEKQILDVIIPLKLEREDFECSKEFKELGWLCTWKDEIASKYWSRKYEELSEILFTYYGSEVYNYKFKDLLKLGKVSNEIERDIMRKEMQKIRERKVNELLENKTVDDLSSEEVKYLSWLLL